MTCRQPGGRQLSDAHYINVGFNKLRYVIVIQKSKIRKLSLYLRLGHRTYCVSFALIFPRTSSGDLLECHCQCLTLILNNSVGHHRLEVCLLTNKNTTFVISLCLVLKFK